MNTPHTPGPWTINGDDQTLIGGNDGKQMLAECRHNHVVRGWARPLSEAQANARLIAAAPDLLAALERIVEHEGMAAGAKMWWYDSARAALAKARPPESAAVPSTEPEGPPATSHTPLEAELLAALQMERRPTPESILHPPPSMLSPVSNHPKRLC